MKKTIFIIFSLLLSTISIYAQTWEFVGLDSMVVKHLYVSGDTIYAGTAVRSSANINSGLYFTSNSGNDWIKIDSSLNSGTTIGFEYLGEGKIFFIKGLSEGSLGGTLYKTTNNGNSWEPINYSIQWFGISPFAMNEIYVIGRGAIPGGTFNNLYKSIDCGGNWQELGPFPSSSHGNELSFAFDLTDSMNLYVSVDDHFSNLFFFKSTDKGDNWFNVSAPPVLPIDIYTDYFLSDRIYLFPGPYISNESGTSWFLADSGITDTSYHLSFYQDKLTTELLYNLRTDGLYSTKNDTFYWKKLENSENLPLVMGPTGFPYGRRNMKNVVIDKQNKKLYIGTSSGIFRTSLITDVLGSNRLIPDQILIEQNFPNPFNPNTTINYFIPKNGYVTLKVYDLLGNEILVLVNGEKYPGNYKVEFNGINFSSGVYVYTISFNRITISKKMMLLK